MNNIKKTKKYIPNGIAHICVTFNTSIISISDVEGNILCWASGGSRGFKGSKKGSPFAAQVATEEVCKKVKECGMRNIEIKIQGPGAGREAALRAIASSGIRISSIQDITPLPHNGCRPRKKKRL
ncbi:MAG: 30S ribosomal protein S11 [Deltaproteobacteria bacterium]|nr:MAG: 30S ribosomal protein S11 [Deltaproteobacteria bacterium]